MSTDGNRQTPEPGLDSSPTATTARPAPQGNVPWGRLALGVAIISALAALYALLSWSGALDTLTNGPLLRERIEQLGWIGPFAVIVLMTGAIVVSPIPSAPIALAAGAAYGHTWGTIYVLIGAEVGALIAFSIARLLGCDFMQKFFRQRSSLRLLGSQNTLMTIVFASRLLPFISFDIVSYAAGLTPLRLWRFAAATLTGIIPASFVLAHFGAEMVSADTDRIAISVLALGAITLVPIAIKVFRDSRRKGAKNNA
ncbi:MAG: TVP38/TMEM64 family protein [Acidiferrobacterales bacterium]